MKRIMSNIFVFALVMFYAISAYASVLPKGTLKEEQLSLGYIPILDSSPQTVVKMYGQPTNITINGKRYDLTHYCYGNSLIFSFRDKGNLRLYEIRTSDKNGIKTADGIEVGMPVSKLLDVYGAPSMTTQNKDITRYWYYWKATPYVYLAFDVKNGVITRIVLNSNL